MSNTPSLSPSRQEQLKAILSQLREKPSTLSKWAVDAAFALGVSSERDTGLQHRVNQWAKAKLAFDAVWPDSTASQKRTLLAEEAMLLALAAPPSAVPAPEAKQNV